MGYRSFLFRVAGLIFTEQYGLFICLDRGIALGRLNHNNAAKSLRGLPTQALLLLLLLAA